LFLKETYFNH